MAAKNPVCSLLTMALAFIFTVYNSNAVLTNFSQLTTAIPMWNVDTNKTSTCGLQNMNIDKTVFSFHGDPKIFCSLNVTVPDGLTVTTEMHVEMSQESFYLFYEWGHNQQKKYAVINRQNEQCFAIVDHNNQLMIHLLGNASILLRFALSDGKTNCLEDLDNKPSCVTDHCITKYSNVKRYANMVTCEAGFYGELHSWEPCKLSFPQSCDISLRYREAEMKCAKIGLKNDTFLVVYPNIAYLDLSKNNIVDIAENTFQGLKDLEILDMNGNHFEHLSDKLFHELSKLKLLDLSNNRLVTVNKDMFETLHQLTRLNLSGNTLTHVDQDLLKDLTNLTDLSLSSNNLTMFAVGSFSDLHSMKRLYLLENQITILDVNIFQDMRELKLLDLSYNKLSTLPNTIFQDMSELEILDLSTNRLSSLPNTIFQDMSELELLDLSTNRLGTLPHTIFHGLVNVEYLYLSWNSLSFLSEDLFHDLRKLTTLFLYKNDLTTLNGRLFQNLSNLESLYLFNNAIENLSNETFSNLRSLNQLSLHKNKLRSLHNGLFNAMGNLEVLFLHDNLLTWIDRDIFSSLPNLVSLSLGGNLLQDAHREWFQDMNHLEGLWLFNNPGIKLDINIFGHLKNLKILTLSRNKHHNLDVDIFQEMVSLSNLDLSLNRLQNIPGIRRLNQLTYLNLRDNPLSEITTESFVGLSEEAELFVTQHEICNCYSPENVNCSAAGKRSPYLTCDRLLADRTLVVIMWVIGLNALGGNMFVLAWRKSTTQKNRVQALLLSSLAMSDFLMGVYMIIVASADIYFGDSFPLHSESWRSGMICRVAGTLSILSSEASVFFVTLISIDRFICIRFPFSTKKVTRKSVIIVIVILTWTASFALGIIPSVMAGRSFTFYNNSHVCIGLPLALTEVFKTEESIRIFYKERYWFRISVFSTESQGLVSGMYFSTAIFLGLNFFCYMIIFGCYFEIVRAVFKSSKRAGLNKEMKEQLRLTAKVAALVITDFACWFPIIILGILVQTRVITLPPSVFAWCVTFVLPINSAINPYLYTIAAIVSSRRKKENVSAITSQGLTMHSRNGAKETD